jgi:CspA family cold shock protein
MFEMEEQNDAGWQLDAKVEEQDVSEAGLPEEAMVVEEQDVSEAELPEEAMVVEEQDVSEAELPEEAMVVEEQDVPEAELPEEAMEVEEQDVFEAELHEETTEVEIQEDTVETDAQDVSSKIEGTVKWFSNPKGYGFISREGGEDVFVHYSEIQGSGFRSLSAGERVEFKLKQSEKGPRAVEVRSLEAAIGTGWL